MISMFIIILFPKIVFNPLFLLKVFGNRKLQGVLAYCTTVSKTVLQCTRIKHTPLANLHPKRCTNANNKNFFIYIR